MKLDISEIYFLKQAVEQVNIKASDAPSVSKTIETLAKARRKERSGGWS